MERGLDIVNRERSPVLLILTGGVLAHSLQNLRSIERELYYLC